MRTGAMPIALLSLVQYHSKNAVIQLLEFTNGNKEICGFLNFLNYFLLLYLLYSCRVVTWKTDKLRNDFYFIYLSEYLNISKNFQIILSLNFNINFSPMGPYQIIISTKLREYFLIKVKTLLKNSRTLFWILSINFEPMGPVWKMTFLIISK